MKQINHYDDLPFEYLPSCFAKPAAETFDELKNKGIFKDISDICKTKEEEAEAVAGALAGILIANCLKYTNKQAGLKVFFGAYRHDQNISQSNFWKIMHLTLEKSGYENFYQKAVNRLINKMSKFSI
jgi:hypothetical protein